MAVQDAPLTVELIPDPEMGGFTAHVPDIPAYGEGETEEEAIEDLKQSLSLFAETAGLEEALSRIRPSVYFRELHLNLSDFA